MLSHLCLPQLTDIDPERVLPAMVGETLPPERIAVILAGMFAATTPTAQPAARARFATG